MEILERVMEMQRNNMSDFDIVSQLRNEGISPKEINDALNQAKIKNAVSSPENGSAPSLQTANEMQLSIMPNSQNQQTSFQPQQQNYPSQQSWQQVPPQQSQQSSPEMYPPEQQGQDAYYPQTPQAYQQNESGYYPPQGAADIETISEIAEQVVSEKINELKKKLGDIQSFRNEMHDKISDLDVRLRRIEDSIDKLRNAVIGKVGEFGDNTARIHKDLENLHGTMSKMMNPLMDNYNELRRIAGKE